MKTKAKECKGITSDTKGFGCGVITPFRKYGLCPKCLFGWKEETEAGKIWFDKQLAYKKKSNEKEKRKEERKQKQALDVKGAMQLADQHFSRYIRVLYSDGNGKCTCFTCGKITNIKEIDNGHYQKRGHKATRYHTDNARPQCKTCNGNTAKNGMQDVFRVNLANEIGEDRVREIEKLAQTTIKANALFYRTIADSFRIKTNELQKEKGVKHW